MNDLAEMLASAKAQGIKEGREDALKELKELLPNCDYIEIEHLITLIEEVEKND